MKIISVTTVLAFCHTLIPAYASMKNINDIIVKANPDEAQDLPNLMQQIRMIPAENSSEGETVYRVIEVEKGSIFDREGVKAGDLVSLSDKSSAPAKYEKLGVEKLKSFRRTKEEAAKDDKKTR